MDEHVLETLGKAKVVIRDGRVVKVGTPLIRSCPLAKRFAHPVHELTPEEIRANMEARIREMGMCRGERRILSEQDFVTFGASELISNGLRQGMLDAAVIVCEGAGTVIASSPALVQGIGGRMSGLVRTTPIPGVMESIRKQNGIVCFPEDAAIDQARGVEIAGSMGYRRVAVTVADADTAELIRQAFGEAVIIGVHLTGITREDAIRLLKAADLVSACASRWIREYASEFSCLQAGTAIPVFAMTQAGKELVLEKLRAANTQILVKTSRLPVPGGEAPEPLV